MRLIDADDVLSIIDDLHNQMTVEGYWSVIERVKALPSAQPVDKDIDVPSTDTISRQDAIRIVDGIDTWQAGWRGNAIESIKALPSAQPERKTGEWIHDGYAFKGGIDWMHCSECGHKDSWSAVTRTPFCAWCGARMEGE